MQESGTINLHKFLECLAFLCKFFLVQVAFNKYSTALFGSRTCMLVTKLEQFDWLVVFCKFLVPETCTNLHEIFGAKFFFASFLYQILEHVSPLLLIWS